MCFQEQTQHFSMQTWWDFGGLSTHEPAPEHDLHLSRYSESLQHSGIITCKVNKELKWEDVVVLAFRKLKKLKSKGA